jgi:MFS family permease
MGGNKEEGMAAELDVPLLGDEEEGGAGAAGQQPDRELGGGGGGAEEERAAGRENRCGGETLHASGERGQGRALATLLLASLLSCGAHVCYKMTASMEEELLESLGINNEQYGDLNSAVSWASLAGVPFAAGVLVDRFPTRFAAIFFCSIVVVGHWIFAYGVDRKSFEIAVLGRAVFGIGESTVLVAQGALVCQWYRSREQLALAIGVTETAHNLANWLGKVSVRVGLAYGGSWEATPWFGLICCVGSLLAAVAYFFLERSADPSEFIARKATPRCRYRNK